MSDGFRRLSGLYPRNDQEADMSKATLREGATQQRDADVAQTRGGSTIDAMPRVRELDHRDSEGIDVTLLWDSSSDQVSIAVNDRRSGEALSFAVAPSEALSAFHHPYAYAARASRGAAQPGDVHN